MSKTCTVPDWAQEDDCPFINGQRENMDIDDDWEICENCEWYKDIDD